VGERTRTRDFARYLGGAVLVRTADEGARIALVLLALGRTGSAAVGGVLVAALLVPQVLAAPAVGLLTDRARAPQWVIAAAAIGFAGSLAGAAFGLGRWPLPVAVGLLLAGGCCGPALTGALSSQLPGLVRRSSLPRAFGVDSLIYNVSGVIGPALAAGLSTATSPAFATVGLAGCAAAGALVLTGLRLVPPQQSARAVGAPHLTEALRLLLRDRVIGLVTAATSLAQLGLGALPVVVAVLAIREHTPAASGGLLTAFASGGLIGSLVWIWRPGATSRAPRVVMAALVGQGAVLAFAAASSALLLTAALFALAGFCTGPLTGALFAAREDHAPDTARAQLFSLGAGLKITATAGGAAVSGVIAGAPTAILLLFVAACPLMAGVLGASGLAVTTVSGRRVRH
jgi:MFS family permease